MAALERVAQLIDRLTARPLHGAGCHCCGGPGLLRLAAIDIEQMILDLLYDRYRRNGEAALEKALAQRAAARDAVPIVLWLGGTDRSSPPPDVRDRLLHDLLHALETLAESPGG